MKKITLRTKITLTIAGLLAVTGIFYAANPIQLGSSTTVNIGVASSRNDLIVTEYCSQKVNKLDCFGNVSLLATIPGPVGPCLEKYVTIAPAQSNNAGFTPRDMFVTQGTDVYKIHESTVTLFATIPGCGTDHAGITFDHFGAFGYNMIVTCQGGGVWQVDSTGAPTQIADLSTGTDLSGGTNFDHPHTDLGAIEMEGPAVVPLNFGPRGGEVWVADEGNGQVHSIASGGTVTYDVFDWVGAEGVVVIPHDLCSFCSSGAFFQMDNSSGATLQYPLTDFTSLGGSILVTSEFATGTASVTWDGNNYNFTFFDNSQGASIEGSSWADCDVPPPTPTPTATATATPTPTPTPTPTATPVASPTPCTLSACTASYPFVSNNPLTNVAFNESEVMRGFRISTSTDGCTPKSIQVFYNDEHALTLGVRQVTVKGSGKNNTTATNYEVEDLGTSTNPATPTPGPKPKKAPSNPGSAINPDVGASVAEGGTDTAGRPMFPALFITDLSVGAGASNALAGDWQYGGTGVPPTAIFGTWKAAVKTIDQTKNPATVTVTPDADPAKNDWNLGLGSDPVPAGLTNEGYGAEVRWDVPALGLISGHQYRLYFMVHDGDQNKTGGDVGQACGIFVMP